MDSNSFNLLYNECVTRRLIEHGFFPKGQSLYNVKGNTMASLLRSTFRGEQGTDIIFCVRHTFLRDYLNLSKEKIYLREAMDYPFRFRISEFTQERLFNVTYVPVNYLRGSKAFPYEGVYYGDIDVESTQEIRDYLTTITENVIKYSPKIMNILSAKKAYDFIEHNNTGAWIEKIWLEDYEEFLCKK